jgi:anti-sigma regulatory factor (Ser/Thr protein kinase)
MTPKDPPPATFRLEISDGLDHKAVDAIRGAVVGAFDGCRLEPGHLYAIATVIEELCTNTLEHSAARWLELRMSLLRGQPRVRLSDNGRPFDVCGAISRSTPDLANPSAPERRLGLYMVRQLTRDRRCTRTLDGVNQVEFTVVSSPENGP